MDKMHITKIGILLVYFSLLAILLYYATPGYVILPALVASAVVWLAIECRLNNCDRRLMKAAVLMGLFLMLFDFAVENLGGYFNLWQVKLTVLHVGYVPIEIMLVCLIGGAAWALAQPKKFHWINTAADIALFSIFGALGEFLLIRNGIMFYYPPWTSVLAVIGYFITWVLLHIVWRKWIGKDAAAKAGTSRRKKKAKRKRR